MVSVTQRIKQVKQPRGGFLKPKEFEEIHLPLIQDFEYKENLAPYTIGMAVDYLTRFMVSDDEFEGQLFKRYQSVETRAENAFKVSLIGASSTNDDTHIENARNMVSQIKGLDDTSIINACKLVNYDSVYRAGFMPTEFREPDSQTIESVRMLVNRGIDFFKQYGAPTVDGFTFRGAYTPLINAGDGDFLTQDTLWDFKVSKYKPNKDHTLQLLIYYLMGLESKQAEFRRLKYIAIYNPRLHTVFRYPVKDLSDDLIHEIRTSVIGYNN